MSSASSSITSRQRFDSSNPCPICQGSGDEPRGQGSRCFGFLGDDGRYAHCSREEYGMGCPYNDNSKTYAHLLKGACKCGTEHGPADPKPTSKKGKGLGKIDRIYDYHDGDGNLVFQVVRFKDPKDFRQRRPDPNRKGGYVWNLKGVQTVLYNLPTLKKHPDRGVIIVEGEKDVENLSEVKLLATCNPMGEGKWRAHYNHDLAGRAVAIIPDNDEVGRAHALTVALSIHKVAKSVKIIELEGLPPKGDVSDSLTKGGTSEQLRSIIAATPEWQPVKVHKPEPDAIEGELIGPTKRLPRIDCSDTSLATVTSETMEAMAAINSPPQVFDFGGDLAWVKEDKEDHFSFIQLMPKHAIRNRLAEAATFTTTFETKKGPSTKEVFPPMDIVHAVAAQKYFSDQFAPPLDMVVESPRFGRDGRLILEAGYHGKERIYYHPPAGLTNLHVPSNPSSDDVESAKKSLLEDYLGDFPFADQPSKANALACMLLPFVRLLIEGSTPLHSFEASTEGTGKGKCANACAYPSLGRDLGSRPQKEDEAEWRKALTSALLPGPSHIYFDNMYNPISWDGNMRPIDSGTLAAFLTQNVWADRILGGSKDANIKIRAVMMASGNNLEWSKELNRRITPIRLRTPQENPSERTGFRCEPLTLEAWAAQHRRELLVACLALCANWIAKGKPPGKQVMGSYESYAQVMGGILDAANVPGFLGNLKVTVTATDRESMRWKFLVEEWTKVYPIKPVTSGELFDLIYGVVGDDALPGIPDLQISFADLLGEGSPLSKKQKLGNALMKQVDRIWSNRRIVTTDIKGKGGVTTYKLEPVQTTLKDQRNE